MKRFTVRSDEDLIALAPIMLGFQPEHSLVMLTFTAFTARVDIPEDEDIDLTIDNLLQPTVREGVKRVAFVIFGAGDFPTLKAALLDRFDQAGLTVLSGVQYKEGFYRSFAGSDWQRFDIASAPVTLDAHYQDIGVRHQTRQQMAESIKPCGEAWDEEARQAVESLETGGVASVISSLTRETAEEAVELWTRVLRGAQEDADITSDIAVVLAFASWLHGDGAKAWAAIDMARESTWQRLIATVLEQAISPNEWDRLLQKGCMT